MRWYYEKEGVSQGPCPEEEIIALVQKKQVQASTLIWHSGLEDWGMVRELKPEWLEQPAVPAAAATPPPARQTVPRTEGPLPAAEAAQAPTLAKPKAGLEKPADDGKGKGGLLGRLFGFGKKKK